MFPEMPYTDVCSNLMSASQSFSSRFCVMVPDMNWLNSFSIREIEWALSRNTYVICVAMASVRLRWIALIAETWSYICRWRCRCPRPLLKLFINAMHHTLTELVPSAAALMWCIATYRQVLTTAFMSCRLVDRPTFAGWSPVCIDAASCNSMICWAA